MRTSRLTGAPALLIALALTSLALVTLGPRARAAQVECPEQQLGAPSACLVQEDDSSVTTLAPEQAEPEPDPGAALWVGAVFGLAGLAGIVFATARVRDAEPQAAAR